MKSPVIDAIKPTSTYCLIRITSRSGLGASPRMRSTSPRLRATSSAMAGSVIPRGGRGAVVKEGSPASSAIMAKQITARTPATRSSLREETGCIASEVSQNNVGPGAPDRDQRFQHGSLILPPAALDRRHQHAEFAGDLIGGDGHREEFARLPDQIEIGEGRLNHQHIRAFLEI